ARPARPSPYRPPSRPAGATLRSIYSADSTGARHVAPSSKAAELADRVSERVDLREVRPDCVGHARYVSGAICCESDGRDSPGVATMSAVVGSGEATPAVRPPPLRGMTSRVAP